MRLLMRHVVGLGASSHCGLVGPGSYSRVNQLGTV